MTKEQTLTELSMAAKGRSLLYRILASLYLREPSAESLQILSSKEVVEALEGLGVNTAGLRGPGDQDAQGRFLDGLAEEYAALFILPGGVSPYESVRTKGLLCQDPEWKAREFYKRFGVTVREDSGIFSDHIGMELDFISYLSGKEAEAWAADDEKEAGRWEKARQEFFGAHLKRWVDEFLEELDRCAFHDFYRAVSVFTRKLTDIEGSELPAEKTDKDASAVMTLA